MKKILCTIFLCLLSGIVLADKAIEYCQDAIVPWEGHKFRIDVFTTPEMLISNDTDVDQMIHIDAKTIDLESGETGSWVEDKVIKPHKQWSGEPNVKLYMAINSHGNHYFKGTVTITGYKQFYAEATCHILAKRYDFGDFTKGLVKHSSE